MITDILGYLAGFLCVITMFPQIYRMIKTKRSDDISYGFLIIGSVSSVIWILYGIMKPDYVILTTDSIILIIQSISFYIFRTQGYIDVQKLKHIVFLDQEIEGL